MEGKRKGDVDERRDEDGAGVGIEDGTGNRDGDGSGDRTGHKGGLTRWRVLKNCLSLKGHDTTD